MARHKQRDIAAESMTPAELREEIELVHLEIAALDEQIESYKKSMEMSTAKLKEQEARQRPLREEIKTIAILTLIGFVVGVVAFFLFR